MNVEADSPVIVLPSWFTPHIGALTPSEKEGLDLTAEYQRGAHRQSLAQNLGARCFVVVDGDDLKIQTLDEASLFTKIAYYFGWYQACFTKGVEKITAKRTNQIQEFKSEESPKTLIELRDICVRVRHFSLEMLGMRQAVEKGRLQLEEAQNELDFVAWRICKLAQWIINAFMRCAKSLANIKHMHLMLIGTENGGYSGIIEELRRGKFAGCDTAHLGVRIGETDLTMKDASERVGIYARLYGERKVGKEEYDFPGSATFSLSQDGSKSLGDFNIQRYWTKDATPFFGENANDLAKANERNLSDRKLYISNLVDRKSEGELPNKDGSRPIQQKLVQLAVAIFAREGDKKLLFSNYQDEAYVFTAAGFDSEKRELIDEKIRLARAAGIKFPYPRAEGRFSMMMRKPENGSILDLQVDLGDGMQSWGQIFERDPMIPGQDAILPRFYMKDLFEYEVKAESHEEKEPR